MRDRVLAIVCDNQRTEVRLAEMEADVGKRHIADVPRFS